MDVYLGKVRIFTRTMVITDSTRGPKYLAALSDPVQPSLSSEVLDFQLSCVQTSNRGQKGSAGLIYLDDVSLTAS